MIDTHLQAEYMPVGVEKPYKAVRQAQLAQLIPAVAAAAEEGPVLIGGDFNTTPHDTTVLAPAARAGWVELTADLRRTGDRGTHMASDDQEAEWLDYVFGVAPPGLTLAATASLICNTARDIPYSDHHGMFVDVSVKR